VSSRSSRTTGPSLPAPAASGAGRQLVLVGEFGRAQGLRGEVRLKSFTAEPAAIARFTTLQTEDGSRRFRIEAVRPVTGNPDMLIARVAGVTDRTAAEALTRVRIYVPRESLDEEPLEEDEYLHADLIGLEVHNPAGEVLGHIVALYDFGAGDVMEVAPRDGGASVMWPFTKAFVPQVDIPGGRVVVAAQTLTGPDSDAEGEG